MQGTSDAELGEEVLDIILPGRAAYSVVLSVPGKQNLPAGHFTYPYSGLHTYPAGHTCAQSYIDFLVNGPILLMNPRGQ